MVVERLPSARAVACRKFPPPAKRRRDGPPTSGFVVDWIAGRATLYNRVGVVKGHVYLRRFLSFPFVESFCFCSCCRSCLALIAPRLALRILRWKFGSTNHLSGHSSSDRRHRSRHGYLISRSERMGSKMFGTSRVGGSFTPPFSKRRKRMGHPHSN